MPACRLLRGVASGCAVSHAALQGVHECQKSEHAQPRAMRCGTHGCDDVRMMVCLVQAGCVGTCSTAARCCYQEHVRHIMRFSGMPILASSSRGRVLAVAAVCSRDRAREARLRVEQGRHDEGAEVAAIQLLPRRVVRQYAARRARLRGRDLREHIKPSHPRGSRPRQGTALTARSACKTHMHSLQLADKLGDFALPSLIRRTL